MSILSFVVNSILCVSYRKKYQKFMNVDSVQRVQEEKLRSILLGNQQSEYGMKYDFAGIKTVDEFREKLPITKYEDYLSYIEKISQSGTTSLYSEKTLLLEKSSGSSSASKLIPYTQGLKEDFDWGIAPWYYNLYTSCPKLKWGKSYWSITPVGQERQHTPSGIPIGFESDSGYLGKLAGKLQSFLFAVPNEVAKFADMEDFKLITCKALLKCRNLRFLSVWNPTFFLILLEHMSDNSYVLTKNKDLRKKLAEKDYQGIWKDLTIISCWNSGGAANYAKKLADYFPKAMFQPKGLIATECFVSFPLLGEEGSRISVFSHFFEFIQQETGKSKLAHELEPGKEYRVVVTTSGGLYRYDLGDVIKVVKTEGIPQIEFVGRGDKVSDLFGEKLNEQFVQATVESLLLKQQTEASFFMLAPEKDRYILYIKSDSQIKGLDEALCENFHYDYCRRLGQLKPAEVKYLSGNPTKEYLDECVARGQRLGNIKPTALHLKGGWDSVFKGGMSL